MTTRRCPNCDLPTQALFCLECWRMVVATVIAELVVAVILWKLRG